MALLVPDEGEVAMLERILNQDGAMSDVYLRLYDNDVTPGESDTMASGSETYTECTETGYAAIALTDPTNGTWTISTTTGTTSATFDQQDFVLTSGPVNIYGYYVTSNTTGDVLMWAERFDTTAALGAGGGTVSVTPYIELD